MKLLLSILLLSTSLGLQAKSLSGILETVSDLKKLQRKADFHGIDDLIYKRGEFGGSVRHKISENQYVTFFNSHTDGLLLRVYHTHEASYARLRPGNFTEIETSISLRLKEAGYAHTIVQLKTESRLFNKDSVGQVRIFKMEELSEKDLKKILRIVKHPIERPSF